MPNNAPPLIESTDLGLLLNLRDWVVVRQDDREVSSNQIRELAKNFAVMLRRLGTARIALHAVRADITLAALIATSETGCELLLIRELFPQEDSFWRTHEIKAVFDQDLNCLHSPASDYRPEKAAVLLTTSGTTGKPKVVLHEIEKLLGRVRSAQAENRWLLTYHPASFAGLQVILTAVRSYGQLVAFSGLKASELVMKALSHDVTHLSGTPTFWRSLMLTIPQSGKRPRFEQITIGGEAVDQNTIDTLHSAFPQARIIHIYASSEAGALFAVKDMRAGFPAKWLKEGVDGCGLRIQDDVLQVKSPRSMKSYCGPEKNQMLMDDGWMITGDLVEVVGDRVFFHGRLDNIINVGGGKVMPEQVEKILLESPIVRETRVYGIKNPIAGDVLAADVVLAKPMLESEARLQLFSTLSSKLESYKVPRMFQFLSEIPTNATGKKMRTDL